MCSDGNGGSPRVRCSEPPVFGSPLVQYQHTCSHSPAECRKAVVLPQQNAARRWCCVAAGDGGASRAR
eukprot:7723288-Pyramimonas_sp.AAC.1